MPVNKSEFNEFLEVASSSKEVPIIIADTEAQLHEFRNLLNQAGYKEQESVYHLIQTVQQPSKSFLILDGHHEYILKQAYDFVVQYPTGQVEVSDQVTMQKAVFTPNYEESACVLLVTQKELQEIESTGLAFLAKTGAAYQNA